MTQLGYVLLASHPTGMISRWLGYEIGPSRSQLANRNLEKIGNISFYVTQNQITSRSAELCLLVSVDQGSVAVLE